jgi:hypothetical protein
MVTEIQNINFYFNGTTRKLRAEMVKELVTITLVN